MNLFVTEARRRRFTVLFDLTTWDRRGAPESRCQHRRAGEWRAAGRQSSPDGIDADFAERNANGKRIPDCRHERPSPTKRDDERIGDWRPTGEFERQRPEREGVELDAMKA